MNLEEKIYTYMEPFLLVNFLVQTKINFKKVIDLGTGYGTIPFLISEKFRDKEIAGIDIQKEFIESGNRYQAWKPGKNLTLLNGDLREINKYFNKSSFDLVTFNPPYFRKNEGRLPLNKDKEAIRFEINGTLHDFFKAALYLLQDTGWIIFVYPLNKKVNAENIITEFGLKINARQYFSHSPESKDSLAIYLVSRVNCNIEELKRITRESEEYKNFYNNFFNNEIYMET
ncbi:MAG: methyltransferase domain-containing protein [bacterium]|nr:methyltransferase domain-containing protein [bacterium]